MIKNEMTIEELEKEYEQLNKQRDNVSKILNERKKAEEEKKKAELAAVKEARYKEIQDAEKKFIELKTAYIKDYGSYSAMRSYNTNELPDIWKLLFD